MKKKIAILVLCVFLFVSVGAAQDISGHWTGKLQEYTVTYDFKADGNSLTGKDTHPDGSVSDISNGKIMAENIEFDVPIQGEITHVTGKLKGDVLTINFSIQGYDVSVDMKKSK
ncbi:MAG: hypothetical protein ABIO82_05275 [Ginsengibacter sp.]